MFSASWNLRRRLFGQLHTNRAQVIIEVTFCFIIVIIFLIACFKVLLWTGKMFVGRQKTYEDTRTSAEEDFYAPESLNMIPTINRD
jgi:hypothetical protein